MLIWCPHKGLISALVVLLWLLINIPQICSVHTVANEGKETNELNSAKRKQCPFWNTVCRTKTLSMCMYICVCVFFPCFRVCVCVLKRRWKLLNIHGVCARLGPRDKTFMFWQPKRERVCVCLCVHVCVCVNGATGWGQMGAAKMCRHQWFNGLNLTWAN